MQRARKSALRLGLAALPLVCIAGSRAQQETPSQNAPAPIVRVRPRPQPNPAQDVPSEAAPLAVRPPRPRPINPATFGGVERQNTPQNSTQTTRQATPAAVPRTAHPAGAAGASGSTGAATAATKPTATSPKPSPSGTSSTASASAHPATAASKPGSSSGFNRTTIVIDPGHGGQDSGSRIGDNILEKNVTLDFAFHLRSLLTARGFTVVLTRESDLPAPGAGGSSAPPSSLTLDDRAGIANHARAAACLLLHATGRGNGMHMYSSDLEPAYGETMPAPWLTAQAPWVPASQELSRTIASALGRSHIALVSSAASIRPVDSLTCPALVLELAPEGDDPRSVTDAGYQDRVAAAVAGALVFWQNQVQPPARLSLNPSTTHTATHRKAAPALTPKTEETQP